LAQHREQLSLKLLELLEPGAKLPYSTYAEAAALAEQCRRLLDSVFRSHDVLLVPSAPGEAPRGLDATGDPLFNRMWTLLHVPAVTLPGFTGANGLPVGVQVIGPVGQDDRLLAMAAWMHARIG
jgi:Asp-tRNA(Asn)/Glu-tRNA(Gln) amidotransferase A subunit family amidase